MQELDNATAIKIAADILGFKKVGECVIDTVKGPKQWQMCIVIPDDFYALRKNDKRPYILPGSSESNLDSDKPAP